MSRLRDPLCGSVPSPNLILKNDPGSFPLHLRSNISGIPLELGHGADLGKECLCWCFVSAVGSSKHIGWLCGVCSWIIVRLLKGTYLCMMKTKCAPSCVSSDSVAYSWMTALGWVFLHLWDPHYLHVKNRNLLHGAVGIIKMDQPFADFLVLIPLCTLKIWECQRTFADMGYIYQYLPYLKWKLRKWCPSF